MISLPALPLVWWRMFVVVAVIALIPRAWRGLRAMSPKLVLSYAGIGVLVYVIRTFGGYPDGVAFAVLLMNIVAPTLDLYTQPRVFGARRG